MMFLLKLSSPNLALERNKTVCTVNRDAVRKKKLLIFLFSHGLNKCPLKYLQVYFLFVTMIPIVCEIIFILVY